MIYPAAFAAGLALRLLRPHQTTLAMSALAGSGIGMVITFMLLRPIPELLQFLPELLWALVLCAAAEFFGGRLGTHIRH